MSSIAIRLITLVLITLMATATGARDPVPQTVRRVATLHVARAAHTATTLRSGRVLIAGGMTDGGGGLRSAELYDPADDTVEEVADLTVARVGHSATLLPDGRVLIAGGFNGSYLTSLEIFDPSTRRSRGVGSMREGRSGHTATLLQDGRVLFVGGVGRGWTFLGSAETYDPETGASESVGTMTLPRESHTATLLQDGRVLIVGGHAGRRPDQVVHRSSELFSPTSNTFAPGGMLITGRHKHDAVRLSDGRVLVIGGADHTDRVHFPSTEFYDPDTRSFEEGPVMAHGRYKIAGTSVLLPDGNVLITSGASVAELLDVTDWVFRRIPGGLPEAYRFAAAASLADGVVVSGGYSDSNLNTAGVWRFGLP